MVADVNVSMVSSSGEAAHLRAFNVRGWHPAPTYRGAGHAKCAPRAAESVSTASRRAWPRSCPLSRDLRVLGRAARRPRPQIHAALAARYATRAPLRPRPPDSRRPRCACRRAAAMRRGDAAACAVDPWCTGWADRRARPIRPAAASHSPWRDSRAGHIRRGAVSAHWGKYPVPQIVC